MHRGRANSMGTSSIAFPQKPPSSTATTGLKVANVRAPRARIACLRCFKVTWPKAPCAARVASRSGARKTKGPGPTSSSRHPGPIFVQVAALLGCSNAHVYLLCEQGKLPHSREIRNAIKFGCQALGRLPLLHVGQRRRAAARCRRRVGVAVINERAPHARAYGLAHAQRAPRAINSSTLERNSFKVGDVFALL